MSTITLHFLSTEGRSTSAQGRIGKSLMEAAVAAGIEGIAADCGGLLTCATCHVMVQQPFAGLLPPADGEELGMLAFTATAATPASRLSCQIRLSAALDGLTVQLPSTQY